MPSHPKIQDVRIHTILYEPPYYPAERFFADIGEYTFPNATPMNG